MVELFCEATNLYDGRLLVRRKASSRTSYHPAWEFWQRLRKILDRGPIVGGSCFRSVALFQKQIIGAELGADSQVALNEQPSRPQIHDETK
jgi:hypothetical protein